MCGVVNQQEFEVIVVSGGHAGTEAALAAAAHTAMPAHGAACAGGAVRARRARTPCAKRLACASDVFLPGSRTGLTRAARGQSSIGRLRPL